VKLLLDEMFSKVVAEQLRARGHDVVAVTERDELRGLPDEDVFAWAQEADRGLVTDNHRDFAPLHHRWLASGRQHSGLILTSNHRFPRGQSSTTGKLVSALDKLLTTEGPLEDPGVLYWLQ
jgi:predicted nuclease of predicted toxin-antitoxin system